jgi:hypothetical protein
MKCLKAIRQLIVAVAVLVCLMAATAKQAHAQFAVFDASNWAMMGKIWNEDVSTGVKMSQELQQGLRLYNSTVQIYGLALQETQYLRNKQIFQAIGFAAQHAQITGRPGWDRALSAVGGLAYSGAVWQQMTNPNNSLQSRIQLADSFGSSMLNALGSCNAAAAQQDGVMAQLEQVAIDLNPAANTRANQANLANMSLTQQNRMRECQLNIQQQQAQVAMLHMMAERDRDQNAVTTNAAIDSININNSQWNTNPAGTLTAGMD